MSTTFNLPDLGEGLTEATVLHWLVGEGDVVEVDQPIVEVETAKSAIEVPSPYAGTVLRLYGAVGDVLEVDKPLITLDCAHEAEQPGALSYRQEEQAGMDSSAAQGTEASGNVLIGYGTSDTTHRTRRRRRGRTGNHRIERPSHSSTDTTSIQPTGAAPAATQPAATDAAQQPGTGIRPAAVRVSSPLVRRLARSQGITLNKLTGSGPDGLIMRADVEAAISAATSAVSAASASQDSPESGAQPAQRIDTSDTAASGAASQDRRTGLNVLERVPMTGIRRSIAAHLAQSRQEIPEATVWQDIDITELVNIRARLKEADPAHAPSVLAFLSRFVLAGLQRYPELATRIDTLPDGSQELVHFDGVNLGFAAETPRGLVVPVLKQAQQLNARKIHSGIAELAAQAREGSLRPQQMRGSTFTVNNYGVFGSDGATPIINHPEVAILGMGRILPRPWVVEGELAIRQITTLSLAFDHRVCDGGSAGGFLNFVAGCMENPSTLIAEW